MMPCFKTTGNMNTFGMRLIVSSHMSREPRVFGVVTDTHINMNKGVIFSHSFLHTRVSFNTSQFMYLM